ncbi:hypothetical protein JAAARDRAFT_589090 [Jaapia argillacea MUCL 33604]|uniref:N-acetyltransferase domain-containing protein n=1 Tax=Jaapia argillacea MUCL 33604 TaxID=933084 RepID=A0A067PGW0_9AGAM|nr:hypothetical protein JAAARDRAFT_589090 [Jaapia argillacea MUCL 33604]
MSYTNSYTPTRDLAIPPTYGLDPYDINFVFPLPHTLFENSLIKLTPFIPRIHAEPYLSQITKYPEIYRYYPYQQFTLDEFLPWVEGFIRRDKGNIMFAIIDKTREGEEGALAGTIGLFKTSAEHLTTEIATLIIFPPFQRTHITSQATSLLLRWALDLPSDSPPGLGLRRVQWSTHPGNLASRRAAERLGMKLEGLSRWTFALPIGAEEGKKSREGDPAEVRPGRDNVLYAICWDDWEGGVREVVRGMLIPN